MSVANFVGYAKISGTVHREEFIPGSHQIFPREPVGLHRLVVEVFQTVMVVFSEAQAVNCMGEFMNDYSNVLGRDSFQRLFAERRYT